MKYSDADLEGQISSVSAEIDQAMDKLPGTVNELSDEEKEQLRNGTLSEEQAIELMLGKTDADNPTVSDSAQTSSQGEKMGETGQAGVALSADEERVDALVAKLYVLQTTYTAKLDGMVSSAISEYKALPESERASAKTSIFSKFLVKASGMEGTCDASVNSILSEMEPLLKKTDGDLSVVSDIRSAYEQQKALKKAYYISMLKNS